MASHRESDGDEQELLDFRISEDVAWHGIHEKNNDMAYMSEPKAARCRPTDNGRGPSPSVGNFARASGIGILYR